MIHSHDITPKPVRFDGRFEVTMIKQLTLYVTTFIKKQVLSRINMANLLINLEAEFPSCLYHYQLIRRVQDSILDKKYGKDCIQLHELFVKRANIQKHGGGYIKYPETNFKNWFEKRAVFRRCASPR